MYKSYGGLGIYSNRFCIKLSILLSKKKVCLIRYRSHTKGYPQISNQRIINPLPSQLKEVYTRY